MVAHIVSRLVCGVVGTAYDLLRRDFPDVVRVETTNACNARCTICPHHRMRRPTQSMDGRLYRQIIDECAAANCREIHLHNFGEPLLDRHLESRICYAKQAGLRRVKLFSNGSLLTATRMNSLIDAGLDQIKISIDGASQEEFERIRYPLQFARVIGNIRQAVAIRNERKAPLSIHVACCSTSDKTATMAALEGVVDGFSFSKIHNWAGEDEVADNDGIRKPCSRLWRTFTVLVNGDVALCCLDYDGQAIVGQIDAETSIREIWNSPAYRHLRSWHKRAQQATLGLCGACTKSYLVAAAEHGSDAGITHEESVITSIRPMAAQQKDRQRRRAA